ncbi:MAG: SUMF1/EgtB/PvdO family nonheme iron enzyme, partial [Chloroflexaceae bacterium]|nr:SUMF1/EgtB/PvdO family nonheme iron enzyme [Chloroflexaceae bacterium]
MLLDGLDEIADTAQRRRAAAWIAQQIEQYHRTVFVVTARPVPYAETEIDHSRVSKLQMESFTREQQREFLQKWYTATLPAYPAAQVQAKTETTLAEIAQNPSLRELAGNPLLLTMIATLTLAEGALPETRSALYDEFYTVLVRRRADRKGVSDPLRSELKDAVLKTLAFAMMQAKQRELPDAEAQAMIEPQIANLTIRHEQPDFSVLKHIQATTNLILEVSGNRWAFAHLSFQEYLATFELHQQQQQATFAWADVVADTWWAETLRFYAEQHDATPIVRAALAHNAADAFALADLCRQVTQRLDPQVRDELEQRFDAALEAADENQCHTAAEVLFAQRFSVFHAWQQLPMGTELDTTMITCAEYQLFLDQARRADEYYHPHHWEEDMPRFARGDARKPIVGVLFGDAQAFVDWLNRRDTKGWSYRLPSAAELEQLPVPVEVDRSCWYTVADGTGQLMQLSAKREQQIRKQLAADGQTAVPMPAEITNLARALAL